jgi:prepilin-type N-terminal cleavage/methylation domain-containing protein
MHRRTHGFTLIELVIALLIGTILTSVAMGTFKSAQGRLSVRSAKATYASLHARARAIAIERGTTIDLVIDSNGDSAYIETAAGVQEVIRFGQELNIDLRSSPSTISLCMTPRGYADPDCGTPFWALKLEFWQNSDSTSLTILRMGQLAGM